MCFTGEGNGQPTPEFSPGEFHGQRSLAGHPPWGRKELDRTEQLTHTQMLHKQSVLVTTKQRTAQWGPNHQWRGRRIRAELPTPTRSAWQLRSVGAVGSAVTGRGEFTPCFPLGPELPVRPWPSHRAHLHLPDAVGLLLQDNAWESIF